MPIVLTKMSSPRLRKRDYQKPRDLRNNYESIDFIGKKEENEDPMNLTNKNAKTTEIEYLRKKYEELGFSYMKK